MTIRTILQIEAYNNQVIELLKVGEEYRIDSRKVANGIGIQHHNFIETLRTYQEKFEHFGLLPFQTEVIQRRGQPEKYALLNRNQVLFAITLSRNTEQVIAWKMALIDALDQLEKQLQTRRPKQIAAPTHRNTTPLPERIVLTMRKLASKGNATPSARDIAWYLHRQREEIAPPLSSLVENGTIESFPGRQAPRYILNEE